MAKRSPCLRKPKRTAAELQALVNDPEVFAAVEREQTRRLAVEDLKKLEKLQADVKAGRTSKKMELMVHEAVCQLRYGREVVENGIGPTVGSA